MWGTSEHDEESLGSIFEDVKLAFEKQMIKEGKHLFYNQFRWFSNVYFNLSQYVSDLRKVQKSVSHWKFLWAEQLGD